jgi:hypothetical protein
MAFPDSAIDVAVELKLGDTWIDITALGHVYTRDPITITRGRQDEGSQPDPAQCTLTINNRDGRYSPRNPLGPYYGLLGRNTPLRVRVGTGPASMRLQLAGTAGANASTPDAAAIDITGDLDVRVDVDMPWVGDSGGLVGKYVETGNQRSWILWNNGDGKLTLYWSTDGGNLPSAVSTVAVPVSSGRLAVRATLDVDNGASGRTVTFYTAPTNAGPWTQLGATVVQAGVTSIFNSTSPLKVGEALSPVAGAFYAAEVRAGIGGTPAANPNFGAQAEGATTFTDTAGRTWTVNGDAEITARVVRFVGEVPSWPIRWDTSGTNVWVSIEASGITRRLAQGRKALRSALYRSILGTSPRYAAWWPLEDGTDTRRGSGGYANTAPMLLSGDAEFTAAPSGGTGGGLSISQTGRTSAPVNGSPSQWTICWWLDVPADLATDTATPVMQWRTPGHPLGVNWDCYTTGALGGAMLLEAADASNVNQFILQGVDDIRGRGPTQVMVQAYFLSGQMGVTLSVNNNSLAQNVFATAPTPITSVGVNLSTIIGSQQYSGAVSHIVIADTSQSGSLQNHLAAGGGYVGETAGTRILRLTGEQGITTDLIGTPASTEPMGPQQPLQLLELLDECAAADGGVLYERMDDLALRYRPRVTDYNSPTALTLDYTAQVAAPLEPVDDDQATRNDVTVERSGGSSARVTLDTGTLSTQPPPDGVGVYNEQVTLNLADDDQTFGQAGWRLHLGTVDEARYPVVRVKLHKHPELINTITAMDLRSRIHLTGLPAWEPPGTVDLLADGYTETIEPLRWTIEFNTVPGSPWRVAVVGDPVLARVQTDGSTLLEDVDADDVAFPVAVAGADWTANAADYPYDLAVGGEIVTATGCGQRVLDNFTRTASSGWGTADTGQTWAVATGTATDFSAATGTGGVISAGSVNVERGIVVPVGSPHQTCLFYSNTPVVPTGAPITWGALLRWSNSSNYYWVGVQINTNSTLTLIARKRVAGTLSTITTATSATTHSTSVWRILRAEILGNRIRAKVWPSNGTEPAAWELDTTDNALTTGNSAGCVTRLETGNTNTLPVAIGHDIFTMYQALTVTRGTNGITKTHAAGTDVSVAQPSTIAL